MQLIQYGHTVKKLIDVTKTLSQLFGGKVILERIPYVAKKLQVISNHTSNSINNNDENLGSDEFFFKDPGKKRAIQMSKPFCSKCNQTIENVPRKIRNCSKCGTILVYKCMTCNTKLTHIKSYQRHVQRTCPGIVDRQKTVTFKTKKPHSKISEKENSAGKKKLQGKTRVDQKKSTILKKEKSDSEVDGKKSSASKKKSKGELKGCPKCEKKVTHLKQHLKVCGPGVPKDCPKCGKKVVYLQKHIKYCGEVARIPCPYCSYRTHFQRSLRLHLKTHLKFRRFNVLDVSQEVVKKVKKRGSLIFIKRHCQKCNIDAEVRKKPDMHNKKACSKCHSKLMYRCIKCEKDYDRYSKIAYHVKSSHNLNNPGASFKCPECGLEYMTSESLKRHQKHCGPDVKMLQCERCPYVTKYAKSLKVHYGTHEKNDRLAALQNENSEFGSSVNVKATGRGGNYLRKPSTHQFASSIHRHCSKCNITFSRRTFRNTLWCTRCNGKLKRQCAKCQKTFDSYNAVVYHLRALCKFADIKPSKCSLCEKVFRNECSLEKHMENCGQGTKYFCELCPFQTKWSESFKSHMKTHETYDSIVEGKTEKGELKRVHGGLAKRFHRYCKQCDEEVPNCAFKNNPRCATCEAVLLFQCATCGQRFERYPLVKYHVQFKCGAIEYVECQKCGKVVKKSALGKHDQYCGKEAIHSCNLCSYKTKFPKNLKTHLWSHENRDLKDHEKIKEGVSVTRTLDLFQRYCKTCKRSFKNQSFRNDKYCKFCNTYLQMECLRCKKKTMTYGTIAHHVKFICGDQRFECNQCDFYCSRKTSLETHILRRHTTIDPENYQQCPHCEKSFKLRDNLKKHMKHCDTNVNFSCNDCSFSTRYRQSIVRHVSYHLLGREPRHGRKARLIRRETKTFLKEKMRQIESNHKKSLMKGFCEKCNKSRILMLRRSKCRLCKSRLLLLCGRCDGRFPNIGALRLHTRSHFEERFECSKCEKGFGHLRNLKMHEKVCEKQSPPIESSDHVPAHDEASVLDAPFMHEDLCEVQLICQE